MISKALLQESLETILFSKRNIYERPVRVLVVSSAVVRSMPEILSKLTTFLLPISEFPQVPFSFFSFKIFLIWGLNLKKPFSDI